MIRPATFLMAVLFVATIFSACKKQNECSDTNTEELGKKEFVPCACSVASPKDGVEEYIKADINGVSICFDVMPRMNDTFPNMLKWGYILRDTGRQYYDILYMLRDASNSEWQAAMFFQNTYALTKSYPYELPRANPEICEIGELQINDRYHYVSCMWCPQNHFNYFAPFYETGVQMKVQSFNNNVFEGTFEGVVNTGSGKKASIKNGRFRIRLVVYRADIRLN